MPKLIKENLQLKKENGQLVEEIDIVKWYIAVLEAGHDTKNML